MTNHDDFNRDPVKADDEVFGKPLVDTLKQIDQMVDADLAGGELQRRREQARRLAAYGALDDEDSLLELLDDNDALLEPQVLAQPTKPAMRQQMRLSPFGRPQEDSLEDCLWPFTDRGSARPVRPEPADIVAQTRRMAADRALTEAGQLRTEVKSLQRKREQLQAEVQQLRTEAEQVQANLDQLTKMAADARALLHETEAATHPVTNDLAACRLTEPIEPLSWPPAATGRHRELVSVASENEMEMTTVLLILDQLAVDSLSGACIRIGQTSASIDRAFNPRALWPDARRYFHGGITVTLRCVAQSRNYPGPDGPDVLPLTMVCSSASAVADMFASAMVMGAGGDGIHALTASSAAEELATNLPRCKPPGRPWIFASQQDWIGRSPARAARAGQLPIRRAELIAHLRRYLRIRPTHPGARLLPPAPTRPALPFSTGAGTPSTVTAPSNISTATWQEATM